MPDPHKVVIDEVKGITVTQSLDIEKEKNNRKLAISVEVDDAQMRQIQGLMALRASWSMTLTCVTKQLPMGEPKAEK